MDNPYDSPQTSSSFFSRHSFLLYRLFSLAGLVPVGGYMVIHLLTNATVLDSPATFQSQVDRIHSLGIVLPIVEWVFIFIPILFHAAIGFVVISTGMPNTGAYPYGSNIRYTLQRATGMIAFFFILWHMYHMHQLFSAFEPWGAANFDPHHASSSAGEAIQASLLVQILYSVGVLACTYHLANGLWTFGITWGIWTSPAAMRRAGYICTLFGLFVATVGLAALVGMTRVNVDEAIRIENSMNEANRPLRGELPAGSPHSYR